MVDSEEDQSAGSPQLAWLRADLAAVDRAVTPWVLLLQHRPLLCSTKSEAGDHTPGGTYLRNLEPTILEFKVDLVINGHEHLYERMNAVVNGTVVATASGPNATYVSPAGPVYVVQGTSGAFVTGDWAPQPAWSAKRDGVSYGYGAMEFDVEGGLHVMDYSFVSNEGKVVAHFRTSK